MAVPAVGKADPRGSQALVYSSLVGRLPPLSASVSSHFLSSRCPHLARASIPPLLALFPALSCCDDPAVVVSSTHRLSLFFFVSLFLFDRHLPFSLAPASISSLHFPSPPPFHHFLKKSNPLPFAARLRRAHSELMIPSLSLSFFACGLNWTGASKASTSVRSIMRPPCPFPFSSIPPPFFPPS